MIYTTRFYALAKSKLKYDEKNSRLSYGLVYLYENLYLYQERRRWIFELYKNYKNITQNDFEKYAKSNSSKNSTKVNFFNESLWILLQI